MAYTAGMMASPAIMANNVSKNDIQADDASMFSCLLTYDAYVSMVPQPMLSEKKACPMAEMQVPAVTLLKSGTNMYLTPSTAPGRVSERTTTSTIITNSTVIMILLMRSMPLCTPNTIIRPVRPRNMRV